MRNKMRCGVVYSEVAARKEAWQETNPSRLKDEPRRGFISVRFFRRKALIKVSFSSREDRAYFVVQFFQSKPLSPSPEKDVR